MKYLKIIYQFLIIFCLMNIWGACLAAEGGGRPISLGGAYIALSDDVHAASWNPAGLAWQQEKEFTYSGIINNRDDYVSADFVSDDYAAFAQPLKKAYHEEYGSLGGIGMYFHNSGFDDQEKNVNTSLWQAGISYGRNFSFAPEMSVGVGLNYYYFDAEVIGVSNTDAVISINLGYLWYINQDVTFGFLLENINEPTYTVHGANNRLIRVLRPSVAYRFSESDVLVFDVYDITGNTEDRGGDFSQDVRVGFEHYFNNNFSGRIGAHQPNSSVDSSKYYSLGLGWQRTDHLNIEEVTYYVDYTFIAWQDAPAGMQDYTHQIGATVKF